MLHEYVTLVLEKIRTKKGQKGIMGDHFDLKKFKTLENYNACLSYAHKFLDMLGQGSSRAAFLVSGKYVLKIALNDKGVGQNEAEVSVFTNPESKLVVAKVFDADPKYNWLISEVVKPIKSVQEFESLTGVDWETFSEYVNEGIKNNGDVSGAPKFIRSIVQTALKNNLLRGDLAQQDFSISAEADGSISHYGKTPDGRVVVLDYGFTGEVYTSHYKKAAEEMRPKSATSDVKTNSPGLAFDKTSVDKNAPTKTKAPQKQTPPNPQTAKTAAPPKRKSPEAEELKTRKD